MERETLTKFHNCPWCKRMVEVYEHPDHGLVLMGHRVSAMPTAGTPWCEGGGRPVPVPAVLGWCGTACCGGGVMATFPNQREWLLMDVEERINWIFEYLQQDGNTDHTDPVRRAVGPMAHAILVGDRDHMTEYMESRDWDALADALRPLPAAEEE